MAAVVISAVAGAERRGISLATISDDVVHTDDVPAEDVSPGPDDGIPSQPFGVPPTEGQAYLRGWK